MTLTNYFGGYFARVSANVASVCTTELEKAAEFISVCHQSSRKVILVGNGGSAAMASHISVDLTKAAGIRAINFNESDLLTCLANDYGYEEWVVHAINMYADTGDLVILISSSGQSQNLINGAHAVLNSRLPLITFSGFNKNNPLRQLGNLNLWVDSCEYNIVEMTHHIWLVAIVDYLISLDRNSG